MDFGGAYSIGSMIGQVGANYFNNKTEKLQADTANYVRDLNNKTTAKENERDAVITATQRWRQGVYNSRVYENAAKDQEVIETNFWRQRDQRQRASFSEQIRNAEEEGRMAAAAAMSGVSGSVVDMLNNTVKLRQGMENQARDEAEDQFAYDKGKLQFGTYWANLDQLDYSLIFDNPKTLDYMRTTPQPVSLLSGITGKQVARGAQALSSFNFSFSQPTPDRAEWDGVDYQATGDN